MFTVENQKIVINLPGGCRLIAEASTDSVYPYEIYVGIEDADGAWLQDICCVQQKFGYSPNGEVVYDKGTMRMAICTGTDRYDWDREFLIPLLDEE